MFWPYYRSASTDGKWQVTWFVKFCDSHVVSMTETTVGCMSMSGSMSGFCSIQSNHALSLSSSHRSIDRSIFIDVYVDTSVQPSKCSWSLRGSSLSPHVQANSLNQLPVGGSAQDWQWDALDQCEAVEKFAFWILQPSTIIPSTSGGPRLFYDILGLSLRSNMSSLVGLKWEFDNWDIVKV